MNNIDIIFMAIKNLLKRKLRTFLTILGVIIGTASIVIMVSLGLALNKNFDSQLSQLSDITLVKIYGVDETSNAYQVNKNKIKMDDTAIFNFKQIENVEAVTPLIDLYSIKAVTGKYSANLHIVGIEPEFFENMGYELEAGRFLNQDDKLNIVCGGKIPFSFTKSNQRRTRYFYNNFGDRGRDQKEKKPDVDVMKDKINISVDMNYGNKKTDSDETSESNNNNKAKAYPVKFVGLLKQSESYSESDYNCYMTIEQAKKLSAEKQKFEKANNNRSSQNDSDGYNNIYIKCKDIDSVKDVAEKIKDMGYNGYYNGEYLENMKATAKNMQGLLGAIGAVSLFVAAIGIANTMIMSVYERTREIGIMKVIGASIRDIKKIFLIEASVIGFLGGIIGVVFSLLVSHILNTSSISFFDTGYMFEEPGSKKLVSFVPIWLCLLGIIFSGLVGLLSGYFPARRATKLSALTAIKSE